MFSKKKYQNINFIENGGWHFTNIKKAEDIDKKMRNFAHHYEYEKSGLAEILKLSEYIVDMEDYINDILNDYE